MLIIKIKSKFIHPLIDDNKVLYLQLFLLRIHINKLKLMPHRINQR